MPWPSHVTVAREDDDDAAVSDGIEEMSEADETDSDSDEYVPSLEDSEDIFAPRAPARGLRDQQVKKPNS